MADIDVAEAHRRWSAGELTIIDCREAFTRSVSVWTTMPSAACVLQAMVGRGVLSMSTMHSRHCPAMDRPGW